MVGKGSIPPPDFNSDNSYNNLDPILDPEAEGFKNLMDAEEKQQTKRQASEKEEEIQKKESEKQADKRIKTEEESKFEETHKGIEEEDSKKLTEDEDLKEGEARRQESLKKGKLSRAATIQDKSYLVNKSHLEDKSHLIEDNQKISETGEDKEGLEKEDPLHEAKQQVAKEKSALSKEAAKDPDISRKSSTDAEEVQRQSLEKLKSQEAKEKEEVRQKTGSKDSAQSSKVKHHKEPSKSQQSIAANLTPGAFKIQASKSQKGDLDPEVHKSEHQKDLEKMVQEILEESKVLVNGDEIKTIISLDMPDSVFNKGQITVSAFKYRPLEVNLKFAKFSSDGTKAIEKNQDQLKKALKLKSLNVHQLEIEH